jgi:hypothetical protein
MDCDFGLLVTHPLDEGARLWDELLLQFGDPDFILTLIELLEQDPGRDDPFGRGLLGSIATMVHLRFVSHECCPSEFAEGLALRLIPLLFRLPASQQRFFQDTFCSLIREWPLHQCAAYCGQLLLNNPLDEYSTTSTAVGFLDNYFRFSLDDICAQDFFNFGALFLVLVAGHMEHSAIEHFPLFLDLMSRCCRCLATLLLTAEDSDVDLIANLGATSLQNFWTCAISAIAIRLEDDVLELIKPRMRILRVISRSSRSMFRLVDLALLVTVSFQVISSTTSPLLIDAVLVLLHSTMIFDSSIAHEVSRGLDPGVLFLTARLTAVELEEFYGLPVRYLDCCLAFSRERVSHCPRSALVQIFDAMAPDEVAATAQQIEASASPSDQADLEIRFFVMNCIALSRKYPLPETFITAAIILLSSEIDCALAATLLVCLSGVDAKKQRRSEFAAIAYHYLQSDSAAVRHSALKLCCQNFQVEMLEAGFVCDVMNVVIEFVENHWHPHLLPILANLLEFPFPEHLDPAPAIIDWFNRWVWPTWWFSEGQGPYPCMDLLDLVLRLLPPVVVYDVASFLGKWFDKPDDTLPHLDVMNVALMSARSLPVFPHEFCAVIPFCQEHLRHDNAWIAPFSQMCVF